MQRLCEIETYRAMSMLGLMRARTMSTRLNAIDPKLSGLVSSLDSAAQSSEATLHELLAISAELESLAVQVSFRFGATAAYEAIVNQRVEVLREERIQGRQTFGEFMMRRYDPAMRTVKSAEARLRSMAERAQRAAELLRTRVDVERSAQNQKLLESMDKRADLQLRLQRTVEGLSVVAISYYAVNLATYAALSADRAPACVQGHGDGDRHAGRGAAGLAGDPPDPQGNRLRASPVHEDQSDHFSVPTRRRMNASPAANSDSLDVLVRLMRLRDVARAADDRRIARVLELPGLGAIADDMRAVVAGQPPRQSLGRALRFGAQGRNREVAVQHDPGLGADRLHRRALAAATSASKRATQASISSPGTTRNSTLKRQSAAVMLCAVPPSIIPTCSVVKGGIEERAPRRRARPPGFAAFIRLAKSISGAACHDRADTPDGSARNAPHTPSHGP